MIFQPQLLLGRQSFTLVATTVMTAVSLLLAGAMLQARAQWRSYSALMVEKLVVDAAAQAEAQDFAHQVKRQLKRGLNDTAPGDTVPTGVRESDFFARNPFQRVEIRGGISRTTEGRAPRLFEEAQKVEKLGAAVGRQPNVGQDDDSLRLPVIWAPAGQFGPGKEEPQQTTLGADDPFGGIFSRSSYAAVAAYSKPRRAFFNEGARVGFGNAISIHARSFPISAFTAMNFEPSVTLYYPQAETVPVFQRDGGRVYTTGELAVGLNNKFSTLTALGGIKSITPTLYDDAPKSTTSDGGPDWSRGGGGGGVIVEPIDGTRPGNGWGRGGRTEIVFEEAPSGGGGIPVNPQDIKEIFAAESRGGLRGTVISEDNGGIELVRNHHAEDIRRLIDIMGDYVDCEITFSVVPKNEALGITHQTIAVAGGGLRLKVDPQKAVEPASLRVIDGGVKNSLDSATVSSGLWAPVDTGGNPTSAFFAQTSETGNGGKLYFNPQRLRFLGGETAQGKPFSIKINMPLGGAGSAWRLFVLTDSGPAELGNLPLMDGITIVSPNDVHFLGNFLVNFHSTPSLVVAPGVSARGWERGVGEVASGFSGDIQIFSTIVTSGASPQRCFIGKSTVSEIKVFGGVCIWEYAPGANYADSIVQAPTHADRREELLSGAAVPALCPVVSEVRVNGNAPFTRRGVLTAKASGGEGPS